MTASQSVRDNWRQPKNVRPDVKQTSMKRTFTKRQKRYLAMFSGGECIKCGVPLTEDFHGDHVVAFSKGGETVLSNGQALCSKCNLRKGSKDD